MKYYNTSSTPQHLTGGGVVAPGESVNLKEADEHLLSLLDAGLMIEVAEEQKPALTQPPGKEGK